MLRCIAFWAIAFRCGRLLGGEAKGALQRLRATRSLALRARGLRDISSADGARGLRNATSSIGFLPHTQTGRSGGQVHRFA